jgi:hypothetical protein
LSFAELFFHSIPSLFIFDKLEAFDSAKVKGIIATVDF